MEESKIKYKTPNKPYYYLHRERDEEMFKKGNEEIVSVGRTDKPKFIYTTKDFYGSRALYFIQTKRINLRYVIGILNSKLIYFWLYNRGKKQGEQLQVDKEPLLNIPIVNTEDEQIKSQLVNLVDSIIEINKQLNNEKNSNVITILKRQVQSMDDNIYKIVYGLYGLSEEEINIIEDGN